MDLEKAYDRVKMEMRMYDVGGKLLNGIHGIILAAWSVLESNEVRVSIQDRWCCKTGVYHAPWLFNVYIGCSDEIGESEDEEERGGDYLAPCLQMTWFCVASRKKTYGQWWDVLLRYVEEV